MIFSSIQKKKKLTNSLVLVQLQEQVGAVLGLVTRRGLVETARRANAPRHVYGEQVSSLVHPASELVEGLIAIERDQIRARVLAPVARTLIHIVVHLVHANGRAVRVHLATILHVQIHELGLVAAHAELRLEELRSTGDVPATVTWQRRVATTNTRLNLAGGLSGLLESVNACEGTLCGRRWIEHVCIILPNGVTSKRSPRAHLVEGISLLRVVVDPGHERFALTILQHILMPGLEVQADKVVEALTLGDRTHQVLITTRLLTHVVGLA